MIFQRAECATSKNLLIKSKYGRGNLEEKTFASSAFDDLDIVYHLASRAYGVGYGKGTT